MDRKARGSDRAWLAGWAAQADAKIVTREQTFFGRPCVKIPSGGVLLSADCYTLIPATGDWTIEDWIWPASTAFDQMIATRRDATSVYAPWSTYINSAAGGAMGVLASTSGSSWALVTNTSNVLVAQQWNHFYLSRGGSTFFAGITGVYGGGGTVSGTLYQNYCPVCLGANVIGDVGFVGYLGPWRVSNFARYTSSNVSPPQWFPSPE